MQNYLFRYGFSQGKNLRYSIKVSGAIEVISPMGEMKNPLDIQMLISQQVESCDQNQAVIKVRIDEVKANEAVPSDSLPQTGIDSCMHMDDQGNVRWVDGQAAWQGAEHSMMKFPEHAIEPGDTWVQQVEDASGSATPFHVRYQFKGTDRRNKRLMNFSSEMFSAHPDEKDAKSIGKGSFSFDLDENWITDCSNFLQFEYQMPIPQNPEMLFTTKTTLRIEMERL